MGYSHSWRARAREDTLREVCDGSHGILPSAKRVTKRSYGPRRPTSQKYSPLKQENQDLFSNGPQHEATDQGGVELVKPQLRIRASSRYNTIFHSKILLIDLEQ